MSDFNLDAAIAGAPITFRNGTPCWFVAYVPELPAGNQLLIRVNEAIYYRYKNGQRDEVSESPYDIIMAKPAPRFKEVTVTAHWYKDIDGNEWESVDRYHDTSYRKRIASASARVTLVEGQFVEGENEHEI